MKNEDTGRLTSLDEFGDRIHIIPAEVRGFFRKYRTWTQAILMIVFLILPWTRLSGHQTILIDIPKRSFAIFGLVFYAHDTPLIFFLVFGASITLALITAIFGRVWCGWACPQTVFIDGVYRRIEQLVEGNFLARRQLRAAPLSISKLTKRLIKWFLFILVSSIIAHSFAAYFIGAATLFEMSLKAPSENMDYFTLITVLTLILLFNFVWFREQFCTIMCPYGRIQSVLLGKNTLTVVYDQLRGEPRKGSQTEKTGDCVNCSRCVQVCPTGIDIRNGLQMECIACTACIDACDEIMEKVKKPKHLIGYKTLDGKPLKILKPRVIAYFVLILISFSGLIFNVANRQSADWTLLRAKELPYQLIKDDNGNEKGVNHFRIHIQNEGSRLAKYQISLANKELELVAPLNPITLDPGKNYTLHFFVKFNEALIKNSGQIKSLISIKDLNDEKDFTDSKEIIIVGPK